jgi:hypothetical protein
MPHTRPTRKLLLEPRHAAPERRRLRRALPFRALASRRLLVPPLRPVPVPGRPSAPTRAALGSCRLAFCVRLVKQELKLLDLLSQPGRAGQRRGAVGGGGLELEAQARLVGAGGLEAVAGVGSLFGGWQSWWLTTVGSWRLLGAWQEWCVASVKQSSGHQPAPGPANAPPPRPHRSDRRVHLLPRRRARARLPHLEPRDLLAQLGHVLEDGWWGVLRV